LGALRKEYDRNLETGKLLQEVKQAPHSQLKDFRVVHELLWRVTAGYYQLVLPPDSPLREVVMKLAHESTVSGHT
jgi:hypothetical protein